MLIKRLLSQLNAVSQNCASGRNQAPNNSVDVHGLAEVSDDALGAHAAGFLLVLVASFTLQDLVIEHGHAAAADPVIAIA